MKVWGVKRPAGPNGLGVVAARPALGHDLPLPEMRSSVQIRVLGELEVLRGDTCVVLPASKKTRALLGYLVVVGVPQPRQRLCELFWDGPDDPRAALRWSLTKLRPLLDDPAIGRIAADRDHVGFEPRGASVDFTDVRESAGVVANASTDALRAAAARFRGELLEGLDLPECYRYHEWCVAEREAARRVHAAVLATLAERLVGNPEAALESARARVAVDPLSEAGHIAVMRLLAQLGRPRDALKQYASCKRILQAQLGRAPSKELEVARAELGGVASGAPPEVAATWVRTRAPIPLVGRASARATIAEALRAASAGTCRQVVLLAGEPGIGKTRLLEEIADQAAALGGASLFGRGFEAEMVRPYGPWIDLLRSGPKGDFASELQADLAPLLPELGEAPPGQADRNRLFDAVTRLLLARALRAPLVVLLDDVQWLDDASVALLHYVARRVETSRVLLACAVRASGVDDNAPVRALLRALARGGRVVRVDLEPLDADATKMLVGTVDRGLDAAQIFADGGGNPLFSLELARALAEGDGAAHPSLDGLIDERLSRLDDRAAEVLSWAAALGRTFSIDLLATSTSLSVRDLLGALEALERHGVLRVVGPTTGGSLYDFAHDLVRRRAYRAISEPRRRWMHLHVARALRALADPERALAGDLAHHAALGGDSELAARAYVDAGERSLRMFAYAEASKLAASGLQHVDRLPPDVAISIRRALLGVQVHSNQWLRRSHELESELQRLMLAAKERGMHAEVSRALYLMSAVHHMRGDLESAGALSVQAAKAGREADHETKQHQLANTGRCLAQTEQVGPAQEFLREALAFEHPAEGRTLLELTFGLGLVHTFLGHEAQARRQLERTAELAASESDHWVHAEALIRLAKMELDAGRPEQALARCAVLEPIVVRLSEGTERPFLAALRALALLDRDDADPSAPDAAIERLRAIDSKAHLAYALDVVAEHDLRKGRTEAARWRAEQALGAAEVVGHKSEAAVARSLLARLAVERGDPEKAATLLRACGSDCLKPFALSARALAAVALAADCAGIEMPTSAPEAAGLATLGEP